jgi:ABC-type amino acid transport substrate-binding protein/serine phosphatase RsbU (regulator of sigma subunit)
MLKVIFLFFLAVVLYADKATVDFTTEEKEWIASHPHIIAGSGDDWAPFNFLDKLGNFKGITNDYLDLVEKNSGLKIDIRVGKWADIYEDFKDGKIDFLPTALYKKEREEDGNYLIEHIKLRDFIYTRDNNNAIRSFNDLSGKTLVIKKGYAVLDPYLPHLKNVKIIEVNSTIEMINSVYNKKADAFIEGQANINYTLKQNMIGGFKSIAQSVSTPTTAHFLVKKDETILLSILDKTMKSITQKERKEIFERWITLPVQHEVNAIGLSTQQKAWIEHHPKINVGYEYDWAPYDFVDKNQEPTGLAKAYLEHISKKTGLKFVYHKDIWNNLLKKIQNKQIDLLPAIYYSKEREKYLSFTKKYLEVFEYIYTYKNVPTIDSLKELNNKRLAVVKSFSISEWMHEYYPKIKLIEKDSISEALQAVQNKEADAFIGDEGSSSYSIQKEKLSTLKLNNIVKERAPVKVYMAARQDMHTLTSIINKTLNSMSKEERKAIESKWIGSNLLHENSMLNIVFDKKERKWLQQKKVIRYSEVNWKPLSIIDHGKMTGIMGDYMNLVSDSTGIEFEFVPAKSWPDVLEKFKNGEIDLVPGIGDSKEERYLGNITMPYAKYPMVIVTNENISYVKTLEDVKDKRFSVPKYYTSYNYLKALLPNAKIIATNSIEEALSNVASNKADVFIGHIAPSIHYIAKKNMKKVKIAGLTKFEFTHHFLMSSDYPELLSITNKVFSNITEKQREKIYNDWVHTKVTQGFDYTLLWKAGGVVFLILGIFFYYNRKLNAKKVYIQKILDSQEQIVVTTDGQKIIDVNKRFLDFFEINSIKEFENNCICDRFNKKAPQGYLQIMMGNETWIDYIIAKKTGLNHKAMITKDKEDFVFSVTAATLSGKDNLKIAVFTDITEMEHAKEEIEEIHKHTRESIEYASLIQSALIPDNKTFRNYFQDYFALWDPKDTVGGDIYLFEELRDKDECLLMVIDCTGHGVPGAFVTMLVKAIERQITAKINYSDEKVSPAKILSIFNKNMKQLLKQESIDSISNAGFDGAIIYYNKKDKILKFAGAETALYYVEDDELKIIKGNRYSVGYKKCNIDYEYKEHIIEVKDGMKFYIPTDGYLDQNGGDKSFPFGKKKYTSLILENHHKTFANQKEILLDALSVYQGDEERNDDITMVSFKI